MGDNDLEKVQLAYWVNEEDVRRAPMTGFVAALLAGGLVWGVGRLILGIDLLGTHPVLLLGLAGAVGLLVYGGLAYPAYSRMRGLKKFAKEKYGVTLEGRPRW